MRNHTLLVSLSALILVASCGGPATRPTAPSVKTKVVSLSSVGLDEAALDHSADACTDFYQFACGGWLKKTEIPLDKPGWTRSFSEINKRNEEVLKDILEGARSKSNEDPAMSKLGAFYGACLDEAAIEKRGYEPIAPLLSTIRKATSTKELVKLVGPLHRMGVFALFDINAMQDYGDATKVIAHLDQNGLGLPDRDYYLNADEKSKELRAKYLAHVERMLRLIGIKDAKVAAKDVLEIETEIARVSKTRVERRDPKGLYNLKDRAGLEKLAPRLDWKEYFKALELPEVNQLNLTSVAFFEGLSRLTDKVPLAKWKSYFSWQVVDAHAPMLTKAFVDEAFTLESLLTGQKEQRARWKRCVDATDGALGELLAQSFVERAFSGDSKEAAESYVAAISRAFGENVKKLEWMDAETKEKALEKLKAVAYLIGYPDAWRKYDFTIEPTKYAENVQAAHAFEIRRRLSKIDKPVDRKEWQMTPPTVNAYYDPQFNEMVFPAGILQPPFYSPKAGVAVNLGAMGMVVGHELTHGFDDEGSQFDGSGNLKSWWTEAAQAKFKEKTHCVADQYSQYEALPGLKLNGELTLGENIADAGGIKLAFEAYRELRKNAQDRFVADGFTEDQQFFLGYGQAWCTKRREEDVRRRAQTDPHSPPEFRVNGPLSHLPEFAEAFGCREGSPMRAENQCSVW